MSAPTPYTLALVTESLADEYEVALLQGVLAVARRETVEVLSVAVGAVDDPNPERSAANFALDLIGKHNVSGILAVSSVLGGSVGAEGLESAFRRYEGIPLCSIGVPLAGYPSVQVDNAAGAEAAVRHLLEEHGAKHVAYVRGPRGSVEAATRLAAYEKALGDAGIPVDPKYVVEGDFTIPSGVEALRTLLDERRVRLELLDAVAAANDRMALGVLEELSRRGIEVPDQVLVTGFDDIPSARLAQPPLTTVVQPIEELGRRGAELLLSVMHGRPVSEQLLATQLKLRRSCGCTDETIGGAISQRQATGLPVSFFQRRPSAMAEMVRAAKGRFGAAGRGWEERLYDAFVAEIRDERKALFNRTLEVLMTKVTSAGADTSTVHEVVSVLRRQLLACVDASMRDRLEEVVGAARVFVGELGLQLESNRRRRVSDELRQVRMALLAALPKGRQAASTAAQKSFPSLGIDGALVTALAAPDDVANDVTVLLEFGWGASTVPLRPKPLSQILSEQVGKGSSRTLIALPVTLGGSAMGFALLSVKRFDRELLQEFRDTFAILLAMHHARGETSRS